MATKSLSTPNLIVGMIVHTWGARMRLVEATTDEAKALSIAQDKAGLRAHHGGSPDLDPSDVSLRAFRSEYVGPTHEGTEPSIPASQRKNWTVQGNHLAMWTVEESA